VHALVEDVLPYLVVFFLLDSLVLVRASEWALLAPWRGFQVERSGLHLAALLPFAEAAGLFVPPLLLSPDGVVLLEGSPAPTEASLVRFDALGKVAADGPAVRIGGRRVATPGPPAARRLADTVRALADAPPQERPARLKEALGGKAELEGARERRAVVLRLRRPVRWLGLAQLAATFGLLPASVAVEWAPGPEFVLPLVLVLHLGIVAAAWRMLRACGLRAGAIATALGPMLLFPPAAIHASGHLSRDLFLDRDPLAAAAAILDGEAFRALAGRLVHRLEVVRGLGDDAAAAADAQMSAWRAVLKAAGTSLEQVLAAPSSLDPAAALYCPLCASEYRAGFSTCSDCGVPLRGLAT